MSFRYDREADLVLDRICEIGAMSFLAIRRMPVILDPKRYDLWLDPGMTNVQVVSEVLKPCDARLMRCYPVSSRVNHVDNDDEECSRPVEIKQAQNRLFV